MKKLFLILLILILGCSETPQAKRDVYGVEIQEFKPDLAEVIAGNDAIVRLKIQNVGDADAKKVKAKIYKCGDLRIDKNKACPQETSLVDLEGADISSNLPGKSTEKMYTFSTKSLSNVQNERVEQEIGLKVTYDYASTATAEIPVLSNARYKELERQGTLPKTKVDSALAPIKVNIISPDQAIGDAPITLDIGLEKTIDGYVESDGCSGGKTGCIKSVEIELSGKGLDWYKDQCKKKASVQLWRTGKTSFSCTLEPKCPEGECSAIVKVTAKYTYVAEASTSLIVKGVPGGVALQPPPGGWGEKKSSFDVISPDVQKAYVSQIITVTGTNFSKDEKDIRLYMEGDIYDIRDEGDGGYKRHVYPNELLLISPVDKTEGDITSDKLGINPQQFTLEDGKTVRSKFKARYAVPRAVATEGGTATINLFAVGQLNENKSLTDTEGYLNRMELEVEPRTKLTINPDEAKIGDEEEVEIRGEKYPAGKPVSISFLAARGAYYLGGKGPDYVTNKPIAGQYAVTPPKPPPVTPDPSGNFRVTFKVDDSFNNYAGYWLVYGAIAGEQNDANEWTYLNGAGELTIPIGLADDDKDLVPNGEDKCSNTPAGFEVCTEKDVTPCDAEHTTNCNSDTKDFCYGKRDLMGCEKMPITPTMTTYTLTTKETGDYTITYNDKEDSKFLVKRNNVRIVPKPETSPSRTEDTLFVLNLKNSGTRDLFSPMDITLKANALGETRYEPSMTHCTGVTIQQGKTEYCAFIIASKDLRANTYTSELTINMAGKEYTLKGPTFTVE